MRKVVGCLLVLVLALSLSFTCFAKDLKIGYVDIFKVFNDYDKTKSYDTKLEAKKKAAEKKLEAKKILIEKMQQKLSVLKESQKKAEEEKIRKEVEAYQELNREAFVDIKRERDEKMKEIIEDINAVIKEYAKKNSFDLVINQSSILYGDKLMDVTSEILKISNQKYKKK